MVVTPPVTPAADATGLASFFFTPAADATGLASFFFTPAADATGLASFFWTGFVLCCSRRCVRFLDLVARVTAMRDTWMFHSAGQLLFGRNAAGPVGEVV